MTLPSYIDLCDFFGLRPCCGETECTCADDEESAAQTAAHGDGCLCCEDELAEVRAARLDRERCTAIPRLRSPVVRSCGRGAWSRPSTASHIDSGSF